MEISFLVSGHVVQEIELRGEFITLSHQEVVRKLESGDFATTVQDGGNIVRVNDMAVVGRVVSVENHLEYTEFSPE